jgi:prefoldin subunit 5
MAITKIHAVKVQLGDAINYIENPDKTDGQELISGYNTAPQTAVLDFSVTAAMARKARNASAKKQGNLAYHLIQSFSPDDAVTPELAHKLGRKLAMEFTDGKFEFVVATHINKDSIHNHIIINAVSFYDYKKLRTVPYRTAQQIRSISDRLCMESQLSVIKDPQQLGQLYPTYIQKKRTTSNRTEVRKKLNFCLERATNYAQFLQMAQELGISVCQRGKHMTYLLKGAGRAIRDTSLADTDKFTYTGLVERLEDNAAEQLFIRERIAKILPNVLTFADFAKLLQSAGVKIRVKKQTGQLMYKAVDLDGTWMPADALGDGFTLGGLEASMKSGFESLDEGHGTPIADLYRELTTEYPQNCDTSVRLTARQICSAGKRGVLLQIQDANGNPAQLMMDNRHIHTTSDGTVIADIGAAFSYDITYDDGTHGTIRGTDLIRQIDEANLTQPLTVSLTADQIIAMSLRGVTVHLPQYHIERLFIPERYVQRNVEQGSCTISLYPDWQYSYVPIGSEKTRKSISGAELAQSLGGVVQVDSSSDSLARRVANVERRAGIANAKELGKILSGMADNGLHSAADFDKQISAYRREETKLRNEIAELRSKSKTYAATAHNLQVCHTYKSVWLEYASQPLSKKGAFYKQNEAALQAYSRAASQLDKIGVSQLVEPEKAQQLVSEIERQITRLVAELENIQKVSNAVQEDKEKVKQIQGSETENKYYVFLSSQK